MKNRILTLVREAAPLDQVEADIREFYRQEVLKEKSKRMDILSTIFTVNGMRGTLCELAIIGLDETIIDERGNGIDEGMTERLMKLHAELSPDSYLKALERASLAATPETKMKQGEIEATNLAALEEVFDAIKRNDGNMAAAIEKFKAFVKSTEPKVLTTSQYHLNLIHLMHCAFDVLGRRGEKLTGGWNGALADKFCFEVIGTGIESKAPPRLRQILQSGVWLLFGEDKKAIRNIDVDECLFSRPASNSTLGVDFFYDAFFMRGAGCGSGEDCLEEGAPGRFFQKLLQAIILASNIYASLRASLIAPVSQCENVMPAKNMLK